MDKDSTQTEEVRQTNAQEGGTTVQRTSVARSTELSGATVASRIVWFIAGFISIVLALRIILLMLGANQGSGFVDLVYGLGGFFAAPFVGIFGSPTYGQFYFDTASLIAIVVYLLIAWGLSKLFTLSRPREEV